MTTETRRALSPRYDAAAVEPVIYERWLESGAFTPAAEPPPQAERFVVIMPPPNVTGALHNGHAVFVTLEDLLVRYHRMRGDDALWLPGADHASIAAQFVLDKILAEEGETRTSLGRDRYLERMWRFMDETRPIITLQMRRLGASADWSRLRFTMDEGSARAVRVAFKRLWDAGLAYRGEALINWCPRCRTTLSDLENVHRDETGTLWTVRYHLEGELGVPDPERWISVATTRPETILGDVAVAVHPADERFAGLVGQHAILPFLGRRLPIVADDAVEREFGTGAVKITPAHDADDYALAQRHDLPAINVLEEDATINEAGGPYTGLDRYEARRQMVEALREAGDLEGEAEHRMVVGHCERCGTVVEPRLALGWFIRTRPLAERALASVREGRTEIIPPRFAKVYAHWMENIHDWAVGRQLWWGHRIPAWYCPDGHVTVSDREEGPESCAECGRPAGELEQDADIFDTWFSSALWPFSTLGWPDDTSDMRRFYPTTVMETGYDILFFWVARMMMMGLFCTDREPFEKVYLHGLVRGQGGVKMSKTKGNVADPLLVIDEIGADALRFALVTGTSPGNDQRLTEAKLEGARNFTNKLWNAARFVLGARPETLEGPSGEPSLPERWIHSRLADATQRATRQLDDLDLSAYVGTVHDFAWSDYCDWFLEMAKVELRREGASAGERERVWRSAAEVLGGLLRLLHPVMPFVTEQIWEHLGATLPAATAGEPLLISAGWPAAGPRDAAAEAEMGDLIDVIRAQRNQRTELRIPAPEWRPAFFVAGSSDARDAMSRGRPYVEALARSRPFEVLAADRHGDPPSVATATRSGLTWIDVGDAADAADWRQEQAREIEARVSRLKALLGNQSFVAKAPPAVVEKERRRLSELEEQLRQLSGN
jgi:valyl-tRNA synthetase